MGSGSQDQQLPPLPPEAIKWSPDAVLQAYVQLQQQTGPDREAFLAGLQELSLTHKESHWLDWNIEYLQSEITKLGQDAESLDSQVKAEMRRGIILKEHIKRLEEQNIEDRVRVQRLVALSQPVTHDITFTATRVERSRPDAWGLEEEDEDWVETALASETDPKVIELLQSIKRLGQEIEKAKQDYEKEVVELQEQRTLREVDAGKAMRLVLSRLAEGGKILRTREDQLEDGMRQYLELIMATQKYRTRSLEEHASLAQVRQLLGQQAKLCRQALQETAASTQQSSERELGRGTRRLEGQLLDLEEQITMLIEQFKAEKPLLEARINELGDKLEKERKRFQRERERYQLEREGFETDVRALVAASNKASQCARKDYARDETDGLMGVWWRLETFPKTRKR